MSAGSAAIRNPLSVCVPLYQCCPCPCPYPVVPSVCLRSHHHIGRVQGCVLFYVGRRHCLFMATLRLGGRTSLHALEEASSYIKRSKQPKVKLCSTWFGVSAGLASHMNESICKTRSVSPLWTKAIIKHSTEVCNADKFAQSRLLPLQCTFNRLHCVSTCR